MDNKNNRNNRPGGVKILATYILIFAMVMLLAHFFFNNADPAAQRVEMNYSEFVSALEKEQIKTIAINGSGTYTGTLRDGKDTPFIAHVPSNDALLISDVYILPQIAEGTLTEVSTVQTSNFWMYVLNFAPTIIMVVLLIFMLRGMRNGGNGGVMTFGKSRARVVKDKEVTFADVAGLEEEKKELSEIVDFLKDPRKYQELGARIPKGVLLVGPPGTGKTYISKAVAGEAGVPFFSISGSDFVEMFVGVGASRVRDLFEDAKKNSPCIVFIDEIDAVGRRRGAGIGGGNDEREQTLNQLLVEMDGFDQNTGIIILAATNRPDVLDPAILRPGRFDRQVVISVPDVKGREEIFKLYAKNKPLDDDVNLNTLAKRTPGFTPADIENMMNEAALLTARRNGTIIHMDDLEEAITRVIVGPKKTSHVMSEREKKLTAFHEAGHAVIQRCTEGSDPVHQVTIMPRGSAGGFTMTLPTEDRYYSTKTEMENEIVDLLGGRLAEKIVIGDISTGASNDLERATKIAHDMVTKYGMTDAIGPVNYSDADEVFLGRDFTSKQNYSESLASKIDIEVRRIIDDSYAKGEKILTEHREELDRVANALLELETLDEEEFEAIFTNAKTVEEINSANESRSKVRKVREDEEAKIRAEKRKEEEANTKIESPLQALREGKRVAIIDEKGNFQIIKNKDVEVDELKEETPVQVVNAETVNNVNADSYETDDMQEMYDPEAEDVVGEEAALEDNKKEEE